MYIVEINVSIGSTAPEARPPGNCVTLFFMHIMLLPKLVKIGSTNLSMTEKVGLFMAVYDLLDTLNKKKAHT